MATRYDAIIIGTGQAGPSLAGKLAGEEMKVAVIERERFGGTCVNTGCTPTKTMVASARAAHVARRGRHFGVNINGKISVDMQKVKSRRDKIVKDSTEGMEKWLKNAENISVYEGHAKFAGPHEVEVNGEKLASDKIFINVGGRAKIPSGFDQADYYTNSSLMDIDFIPEDLLIVGGSYIGLEFGQMFRRFGSKVTIIERGDRVLSKEDEDVSEAIEEIMKDEGIDFRFNANCLGGSGKHGQIKVRLDCEKGAPEEIGTHLLLATGRRPNTDDLGLEKAGIETNKRGFIVVDDHLQTSVENVWALGDCNGKGAFTHTSYNDFEIVAANLFSNESRNLSDRIPCYGLFIDPPLGRVGMTEKEVRESGKKALIASRPMSRIARAKEKGETKGFMKVIVDEETEKIMGAAILGIGGDEIIHSLIDVMYAGVPYTVIQNAVHIHPTVSELIPTMLEGLEPMK